MPFAELTTTVLLGLLAATMIVASLVSIARDADWWVITRGEVRGQLERFRHPSRGQRP